MALSPVQAHRPGRQHPRVNQLLQLLELEMAVPETLSNEKNHLAHAPGVCTIILALGFVDRANQ